MNRPDVTVRAAHADAGTFGLHRHPAAPVFVTVKPTLCFSIGVTAILSQTFSGIQQRVSFQQHR
jgi:hypothetical protein